MPHRFWLLVCLITLSNTSVAFSNDGHSSLADQVAGVYKDRFKNGDVSGATYTTENVLELVKLSEDAIYFRTHLTFYNGHQCFLWGVAEQSGPSRFLYTAPPSEEQTQCRLSINIAADRISFDDADGICRMHSCGARGGYGVEFMRTQRRDIRYMPKLLQSRQYRQAVEDYRRQ